MFSQLRLASLATTLLASHALAQTFTACNPLNSTSCPSDTALGTSATFNFTTSEASSAIWNTTAGTIGWPGTGAEFTVNQKGDSPTIQSLFYIMFGRVSVVMQAAKGQGIVSSIVLESDDLDEVDWEMIGGNSSYVETNFFGKGNTTAYDRAIWYPVDNNQNLHNYTTVWTAEKLDWYVDGQIVRTLHYNDSLALNGKNYPQTPMTVRLGIWVGGDPSENSNGTVEWAGGVVDYNKAPFNMLVESVEVEDFSSGKSYTYGDTSGSWESIKFAAGNSTIAQRLNSPSSLAGHYKALTNTEKIAVAAGALSVAAIALGLLTFCCIKQRRAGRRERATADAEWERSLNELTVYKRAMIAEEELHPRAGSKKGGYF